MDRIKAKGKSEKAKVKEDVAIGFVLFLPFTFLLLPFFYPAYPV
jgi:hypothetical protein